MNVYLPVKDTQENKKTSQSLQCPLRTRYPATPHCTLRLETWQLLISTWNWSYKDWGSSVRAFNTHQAQYIASRKEKKNWVSDTVNGELKERMTEETLVLLRMLCYFPSVANGEKCFPRHHKKIPEILLVTFVDIWPTHNEEDKLQDYTSTVFYNVYHLCKSMDAKLDT